MFKSRPKGLEWISFPDKSSQIPDRPVLTLVVLAPEQAHGDKATRKLLDQIDREHGSPGGRSRAP